MFGSVLVVILLVSSHRQDCANCTALTTFQNRKFRMEKRKWEGLETQILV
jgi:hypothetical protein